jgi:hypothetical protein
MTSFAPATKPVVEPLGLPTPGAGEGPFDASGTTVPSD